MRIKVQDVVDLCAPIHPNTACMIKILTITAQSLRMDTSLQARVKIRPPCCAMARAVTGMALSAGTRWVWSSSGSSQHGVIVIRMGSCQILSQAETAKAPRIYMVCATGVICTQGAVWSCVLNESALLCATASADFSARVWDACSGTQLHEFAHSHIVRTAAFPHHSNKLATGCEGPAMCCTPFLGHEFGGINFHALLMQATINLSACLTWRRRKQRPRSCLRPAVPCGT